MTLLGGEKKTPIQLGNNVPKVTLANKSVNCKRMPRGGVGGGGLWPALGRKMGRKGIRARCRVG